MRVIRPSRNRRLLAPTCDVRQQATLQIENDLDPFVGRRSMSTYALATLKRCFAVVAEKHMRQLLLQELLREIVPRALLNNVSF